MLQNCHRGLSSGCHKWEWYWATKFCFCWLCSQQIWMQVPQLPLGQTPHIQKYHLAKKGIITRFLQDRENVGSFLYFYVGMCALVCVCVWFQYTEFCAYLFYELQYLGCALLDKSTLAKFLWYCYQNLTRSKYDFASFLQ